MLVVKNVKSQTPIVSALLAVYVFWGGSYLAMKIAIETIPPFILGGTRFVAAGLILFIWEICRGHKTPTKSQWLYGTFLGIIMVFIAQGGIIWAQQFVPSGIAAIIFATVPLWMTLISWLLQGAKRPNNFVAFGLVLGFFGMVLQVKSSLLGVSVSQGSWMGYIVLFLAAITWAWGSVYSRVFPQPESPFMSIALQMITGGAFFFVVSHFAGEWKQFDILLVSFDSLFSLGYLVFCGSIIGFSSYIWLLKVADTALVSTYAYVNPVVAVFLGYTLAGEPLTLNDALVAVLILTSVIIISRNSMEKQASTLSEAAGASQ
ncbi:EamA family transporter [Desulfosporosinus sp.]|uniref:EamA family transporter n=1 Tax=Desulfosporosinus sp. TaxID=157907 RepID=UPI0025C12AFD|nr:EamA family transporter [Desulfosporosinus sp.]MBC2724604.1 EamA family transporter [Desulfosporosinus sp.]MBC2727355.1 EamA family transporter [Desulfosporosinus sp.]